MRSSGRRWFVLGRGALRDMAIGAVTGSLLAGLSELFFDAGIPALPYFIGGAITGRLPGLASRLPPPSPPSHSPATGRPPIRVLQFDAVLQWTLVNVAPT
jgi:hypothetical protein